MGFCRMKRQCPDDKGMDCGGKRSATPLWLSVEQAVHQGFAAAWESGVALRLPPQSILALSAAGGASLLSNGFSLTNRAGSESNPGPVHL